MSNLDQFESAFRSAAKDVFHYRRVAIRSVLVVTDLTGAAAEQFKAVVERFTAALTAHEEVSYTLITGDRFASPKDLLDVVEKQRPDLIATYRCLHSTAWQWVYTLGAHIDVLTQATTTPVLLMPHPARNAGRGPDAGTEAPAQTDRVMAVTDHLAGDERLVNSALAFAQATGTLYLTHVEDDATLDRYIDAIGKISEIDTDTARERITAQLLKEPADYIRSVTAALFEAKVACAIEQRVVLGHHVTQYREMVEACEVDLLVLNTKDDDHSAMHGVAYALAVELRDTPLLML